jgi:hypothetical protein
MGRSLASILNEEVEQLRARIVQLEAENKRLLQPGACNCASTSEDYWQHALSCPVLLKGKSERLSAENAGLRELCAEHETCVADHNAKDLAIERLRERVGELESAKAHCHEGMANLAQKVVLLMEVVRWLSGTEQRGGRYWRLTPDGLQLQSPPAHLAPLIAEAVKTQRGME